MCCIYTEELKYFIKLRVSFLLIRTFTPNYTTTMVKMNESAENIGFVECRMKGNEAKWVMQLPYPQCYFQVHEFDNTEHYMQTLGQSEKWLHAQVGSRMMALTFNGCMMHYEFNQDNATERGQNLINTLKEAARWYDDFLKSKE